MIALNVGATPRCIEGLRQGEHVARSDILLALGKKYPAVRALVMRLMDAEMGDSGEDPSKVLADFFQWQRMRQRENGAP